MNFAQRQRDPRRHLVGFTAVVVFHVLLVYALITGLAKKVVDVVRAPLETKVIEEIRKPPPPPEVVVPPPPRLDAPPPPFIPPPEVQVATPPPPQPTIAAVTPTPPPAPAVIAPAPPPVVAAPPAPAPPAPVSAGAVCSNYATVMNEAAFPKEAQRAGLEKGEVLLQFVVAANGEVKEVKAVRSTHPVFTRASTRLVTEYRCQGQGRDVTVQQLFSYKTE